MEMMEITVLRAALETPHNNVGIDILALQWDGDKVRLLV
jgi:hypothetical protein